MHPPARLRRRVRRALGVGALLLPSVATLLAAACADVGTGPADAVSISFDSLPPSIVAGDVLRDANGDTLRLRALARAYNGRGGVIDSAPFGFVYVPARTDSTRRFDSLLVVGDSTGLVRAPAFAPTDTGRATDARLAARLGAVLQILRTIRVVAPPDTLARTAPADSQLRIRYVADNVDSSTSPALTVRVLRDSGDAGDAGVAGSPIRTLVGVPRYLVHYRIATPVGGDSAALLVLGNRQATAIIDTTDAAGQAGPRLRIRAARLTGTAPATIAVKAFVLLRGRPLGDTVTFAVPVCSRGTAGC